MATFWKITTNSVDHMFSMYFDYLQLKVISRFGYEGWIWVLIASVPDLCILFTSKKNICRFICTSHSTRNDVEQKINNIL